MATTKKSKAPAGELQVVTDVKVKRPREAVMQDLCELLAGGSSLDAACRVVTDVKSHTVLGWVERYPELREQYMRARETGYALLADQIVAISDEADVETRYQGEEVKLVLDATAVARNRLRVDTRKWMLSKMLPKVYGDKLTTELTGAGGGAIQVAAVNLKGLSDAELEQMKLLMAKAAGTP